jgi:hypothetical protein
MWEAIHVRGKGGDYGWAVVNKDDQTICAGLEEKQATRIVKMHNDELRKEAK